MPFFDDVEFLEKINKDAVRSLETVWKEIGVEKDGMLLSEWSKGCPV